MSRRRPIGLQFKLTVALVGIVMLPLLASAILIDQIGKVAANFGATEARARAETIEQVIRVYRDLVITTKSLQTEVAQRIAARPDIAAPTPGVTLQKILESEANLRAIAVIRPDGTVLDEASRPADPEELGLRDTVVDLHFASGGNLRLTFRVIDTERELVDLKKKLDVAKQFATTRTAIPAGLQTAFLVVMALAALAAIGFGILGGTLVTRRIAALVTTARRVSDGHHDARV
jgi:nitrogen fixation/metabolism regulation signal transduction histidine kinase